MRPFLQQMLELQIFRPFVEERLAMLNSGKSLSDEFETEVLRFAERSTVAYQGTKLRTQAAQLKREGGAFVKAVQRKVCFLMAVANVISFILVIISGKSRSQTRRQVSERGWKNNAKQRSYGYSGHQVEAALGQAKLAVRRVLV